jgi:diguanylate cyclase (GGDEF)-like protein
MGSFRNRLLVVIIGLVCVTQTVTLIAVLARTEHSVEDRAAKQLVASSAFVEQLVRFRAAQLASGVAVLAADFGFREAVASGDGPTMLSAAQNDVQRIGADLMVLIDNHGHVLASTSQVSEPALQRLMSAADMAGDSPHVMVLGGRAYQFFLAPVRAPEVIGWVAMGFAIDDSLARRMSELAGTAISFVSKDQAGATHVATTLDGASRAALLALHGGPENHQAAALRLRLGGAEYLTVTRSLAVSPDTVDVWVHQPMYEVLAPYRDLRDAMLLIGTVALLLAAGIGMLAGRSASRPIAELVRAARRIEEGRYGRPVVPSGAKDFRRLAATFNTMQNGIAEREARITQLAYHDSLTGLPNRPFAENYIDQRIRDDATTPFALILIDLRNLPEINASLGHHVGDDALSEAARRLRQNAGPNDLVARLSAQQFLIVATPCSLQRAPLMAEQLAGIIAANFVVADVGLELHPTAGISAYQEHGQSARELLRCAQMALHDAQDARTLVAIYRAGRDEQHRRRLALVTELRRALEQNAGLKLVYQPKVEMGTRTVKSVEALARWTHPQLGEISPGEFVPLAEQTGNTRRLTSWVIGEAIRQMAEWRALGLDIDVAVNLSASDILDPQLGSEVLRCLETHGVAPTRLLLEITESAVMRDPVLAARHMQLMRVAGVRFAMDDFGTGYSSLSQLSRLPVDELKIDRSLIAHAHARPDDAMIVTSTIELAHSMGLRVVAEGVETIEVWNLLRRLGCDLAQGFLISKPLPALEVKAFVSRANHLLQDSDSTQLQLRALEQLSAIAR